MNYRYKIITAILRNAFPLFENAEIMDIENSTDFDFSIFSRVHLGAVKLISDDGMNFFFIISNSDGRPPESVTAIGNASVQSQVIGQLNRYNYRLSDIDYIDSGNKNISNPKEEWKKNKIVISLREKDEPFYIMMPYFLFFKLFELSGLAHCGELSEECLNRDFSNAIDNIERSVLHGKQLLFANFLIIFNFLTRRDWPMAMNSLFNSGYISHDHIASLSLLFPEYGRVVSYLPRASRQAVKKLQTGIAPYLENEKLRARWLKQIGYYFQNIFSRLIFIDRSFPEFEELHINDFHSLTSDISHVRLEYREQRYPLKGLIEKLIRAQRVNSLIGSEGKNRLVTLAAFNEDLSILELMNLFRPAFREELTFKISERRVELRNMNREERKIIYNEAKTALFHILERDEAAIIKTKKNNIKIEDIHKIVLSQDNDGVNALYNMLGFETFTSIFEILRYLPSSPLDEKGANDFFEERVSLLPFTERTIAEDIYMERVNLDRIINQHSLERNLNIVIDKLFILQEQKYIGVDG